MTTSEQDPRAALPLWPWTALRPATGMLLGVDDFEVLGGNPRAKHQLHQSWLHGTGVVWGFGVEVTDTHELTISPGLAVDGWGRELHLDASRKVSFEAALPPAKGAQCATREVVVCLIARHDACLDAPVPALADPCDVTRESQDFSRVVERVRFEFVDSHPDAAGMPYHRVRVLLGLDVVGEDDEAGRQALASRNELRAAPAHERARELLRLVRCLAALDAAEFAPAGGDCEAGLFPMGECSSGVLLGCLRLAIREEAGCPIITESHFDICQRRTLVPTAVIQDLLCGLAPGLLDEEHCGVVGPQLIPGSLEFDRGHDCKRLSFRANQSLAKATLTSDSVTVSSLSERGWIVEDQRRLPRYDASCNRVVVHLADRPANPLVRVLVRGTGPTPVSGAAPPMLPLAGVVGESQQHAEHGRDAVLTAPNPLFEGDEPNDNE